MHKFVFRCLAASLLSSSLMALPMGDPVDPALYTEGNSAFFCDLPWRVGFSADHVYNRKMRVERAYPSTVRTTELATNSGVFALNIKDRYDLFATLGATTIQVDAFALTFLSTFGGIGQNDTNFYFRSDSRFSWSIGGRGIVASWRGLALGIEGSYFATSPKLDFVHLENFDVVYSSDNTRMRYHEWQVALGLAYPLCYGSAPLSLIPYTGITFAGARMEMNDAQFTISVSNNVFTLFNMKSQLPVGFPIGVTLAYSENMSATVEGRFGNEKALHVNAQLRF